MDARLQLYNDLKGCVEARLPEIAHFGLWNQDTDYLSGDAPYERPALLVEYGEIAWDNYNKEPLGVGARGRGTVRLHLLTDWSDDSDYVVPFQIGERLQRALVRMPDASCYSVLYPHATYTDHSHASLLDSIDEFAVRYSRHIDTE